MVDKEVTSLLLQQMRETQGFTVVLESLREKYLQCIRTLAAGGCKDMEDVTRLRTSIQSIRTFLDYTGMSKEDVNKWMEIH